MSLVGRGGSPAVIGPHSVERLSSGGIEMSAGVHRHRELGVAIGRHTDRPAAAHRLVADRDGGGIGIVEENIVGFTGQRGAHRCKVTGAPQTGRADGKGAAFVGRTDVPG